MAGELFAGFDLAVAFPFGLAETDFDAVAAEGFPAGGLEAEPEFLSSVEDWAGAPLMAAFNCDENAPGAPDACEAETASELAVLFIEDELTRETPRID